jgi:hypothetical protein
LRSTSSAPLGADDLDVVAVHDGGAVLVHAQAQLVALGQHQRDHAAEAATLEEVLVDEEVGADEAQAAVDLLAVAQLPLHHPDHAGRVAEHHRTHDGRPAEVPATTPPRR